MLEILGFIAIFALVVSLVSLLGIVAFHVLAALAEIFVDLASGLICGLSRLLWLSLKLLARSASWVCGEVALGLKGKSE
jgi:hypothetical protein